MNQKKKGKYIGMAGALLVHLLLVALLLLVSFTMPEQQEEDGVAVMMGQVPDASGASSSPLVPVDVMPQPAPSRPAAATPEPEMLTQDLEESVALTPKKEPKPEKTPEQLAAEKAEEARRLAEEQAARERREAEERARQRVAGAFGKGAKMSGSGTTAGEGTQGSPAGNAPTGATGGEGGYGSFSLQGRSIGAGGLPRPAYNVQDEGRVVVIIRVNPSGLVIATNIDPRQTNTVNPALRKAAEEAAKKARFNAVEGVNVQEGTITYYFNLK